MVSKQMKIGCKTCGARCDGKFCIDCYHKYIRKGRDCKTCNKWCPAHKDLCNLCYRRSPKCTSCDNPHDPDLGPLCKTCYVKSLPVCKTEGCEERTWQTYCRSCKDVYKNNRSHKSIVRRNCSTITCKNITTHGDYCGSCYKILPKCASCDYPCDPDLGPLCKTCYVKSIPVCKTEGCEELTWQTYCRSCQEAYKETY